MPNLVVPPSLGATRMVRYRPLALSDRSKTRVNSLRRRTRRAFEKRSERIRVCRQLRGPLRGRNREALTPLGTAPLQDEPTVFCRHAHEESVRALAAPAVWLESYAHYRIPLGRKINCGET
jgi:hypothetical protein